MLSLLTADFLHGLGTVMNIRHVNRGIVECGDFCSAQGLILQLSITAVAMSTLAIAVQTFILIFLRKKADSVKISLMVVSVIWLYVFLFVGISLGVHSTGLTRFYTPVPFWCWVGAKYKDERLTGEYVWIWLTGFVSIVAYVLLYGKLRGTVRSSNSKLSKIRSASSLGHDQPPPKEEGAAKRALLMLVYPIAYLFQIIGLSIIRWVQGKHNVPPWASFLSYSIFALSGVINVVVLIWTRPNILLLGTGTGKTSVLGLPNDFEMSEFTTAGHLRLHSSVSNEIECNEEDP
ncbi:hypothetical protein M422DRAFT_64601 [Sphaerobolus stellatus SS14]|nr:hypothetical protein M422DRAFT_64601 [Sphaerobolus stellatus SS14]